MQKLIFILSSAFCLTAFLPNLTYANNGPKIKLSSLKSKKNNKNNSVSLNTNEPKNKNTKLKSSKESTEKLTALTKNIPQRPSRQEALKNEIAAKDALIAKLSKEAYDDYESKNEMIKTYSKLQVKFAEKMDVSASELKNIPLLKEMDYWYGTPYRMGGTSRRGVDCSAFTRALVSQVFKIDLPRTAREQYSQVEKISKKDLEEGDLVFFNTRGGVSHVGLYLGNNKFVHSASSRGVMISDLDENYWSARYIGAGKFF